MSQFPGQDQWGRWAPIPEGTDPCVYAMHPECIAQKNAAVENNSKKAFQKEVAIAVALGIALGGLVYKRKDIPYSTAFIAIVGILFLGRMFMSDPWSGRASLFKRLTDPEGPTPARANPGTSEDPNALMAVVPARNTGKIPLQPTALMECQSPLKPDGNGGCRYPYMQWIIDLSKTNRPI